MTGFGFGKREQLLCAKLRHRQYAAIGKERHALAIRSISLDLRKAVAPVSDNLTPDNETKEHHSWDPTLPTRKPVVALAMPPGPVALSRVTATNRITENGQLVPTSDVGTAPKPPVNTSARPAPKEANRARISNHATNSADSKT